MPKIKLNKLMTTYCQFTLCLKDNVSLKTFIFVYALFMFLPLRFFRLDVFFSSLYCCKTACVALVSSACESKSYVIIISRSCL